MSDTKATLRKIWAEVLNVSPELILDDSDFLALGGDSISLLYLHARIEKELCVNIYIDMLFENIQFHQMHDYLASRLTTLP